MADAPARRTYVLVDGENIDATLGVSVLGHRPNPEQRPRWDRVSEFAVRLWEQPVTALFFLNASSGQMPLGFIQALLAMGYHPIPLAGGRDEKVVDIGIQRTLEALTDRSGDVLLASHDADFVPQVAALLTPGRRVGMLCFREFLSGHLGDLTNRGMAIYDLEDDVGAFTSALPRVRIISIDDFDPLRYL
jgi:uncharacterized protein